MITPFEEVWDYIKDVPGSFTRINAEKLYECALESPGIMAEIGVDQGRSASVLAFAARRTRAKLILVDSWRSVLRENFQKVHDRMVADFVDVSWVIHNFPSVEAALMVSNGLSLIHIDGDHWGAGPEEDCVAWLPKLKPGGIACFHDYRVPTMGDAVDLAVDKHTTGWEDFGVWEGLGIRRKPQ
jgi:predicted O-methyltransferase YrrM